MALQFIWWRDISKDPFFEPLQAKFQPERTHSSRLIVIWRLSQSLQNTHWRRQWLPHLTRISSHRTKFLSLGTERSHTGSNPENRMRNQFIAQFVVLSLQRSTCGTARCLDRKALFCANLASNDYQMWTMCPFWLKFDLKGFEEWIFRDGVIKWIVAPFHENLSNLSNDPRIFSKTIMYFFKDLSNNKFV